MRIHLDVSNPHLAAAQAAMRTRAEQQAAPPRVDQKDKPFTISELMLMHNFSRRTIIKLYENEPGVQILQASRDHQRKTRTALQNSPRAAVRPHARQASLGG